MNKNLLLEIRGRSLELLAYAHEKRVLESIRRELVAYATKARRKGTPPKRRELDMKAIVAEALGGSEESLIDETAKDVKSNLKLADKHIGNVTD